MKTGFKDRTNPTPEPKEVPKDGKNSPWTWDAPQYDQRSSCFVNAGTNYGVGKTQPVGKESASNKGGVPFGRPNTLEVDEKA